MLRENIRLQYPFRITDGNRAGYVVSYLHHKGMKLPAIVAERAVAYYEYAFDENIVKYWPHEIKVQSNHWERAALNHRRRVRRVVFPRVAAAHPRRTADRDT
jgi:hypothetical protein